MPDRSEIIGVRLTPDERTKFENHLKESDEFDTLSRFFRVLAHRHIAMDDDEPELDPEALIEAVETAITPQIDRLEKIEEHIVSIDSNVSNDDKIDRLARDIYSSLPMHTDGNELPDLREVRGFENASDLALAQAISTPEVWAQFFEEGLADVRRACARMLEYYPDVEFVRDSTGGPGSGIPQHDNVAVDPSPSHTDSFTGTNGRTTDQRSRAGEDDHSTVRRYYKVAGDR